MINNLEGKKVLVTGGTGMIGRYLVDKLLTKDCDVTVVSLDSPEGLPDGVTFMKLDLTVLDNCIAYTTQQRFFTKMMFGKLSPQITIGTLDGQSALGNYKLMLIELNMARTTSPS